MVLKQDSPYYEFFYHDLKPYVHFIPFKRDLSDLIEKVSLLPDDDDDYLAQEFVFQDLFKVKGRVLSVFMDAWMYVQVHIWGLRTCMYECEFGCVGVV